ncbi:hypothetical protein [Luteolibacter sp. LG18]|uniref:hypothetical protein n=1 Tax=Luteolibacter sp. LG18 TaxID=2819286 RepID=UPI002B2EB40D|nr:hypothetical protein llg_02350 [Luteolibacter sp. LG18]
MSTSPSNSNTSATSSADAQERFIAAALIAHEAHLVAEARNTTGDTDKAREAVMGAFLELCRQSPDLYPEGAKDWLETATAKRARKLAPKGGPTTTEDVRWKRVAGTGETIVEPTAAPVTLLPTQRETILHAARLGVAQPDRPSSYPRWVLPMVGVTVGIIALVMFLKRPDNPEPVAQSPAPTAPAPAAATPSPAEPQAPAPTPAAPAPTVPLEVLLLPLPGPALAPAAAQPALSTAAANARLRRQALDAAPGDFLTGAAAKLAATPNLDLTTLPEVSARAAIQTSATQQLPLPVLAGTASLGWISSSVTGKHVLPPAKAVRLEEILNAFSLKPGGTAAIAKGASVVAESFSCPWKPSATLLMVRIQGAADGQRAIEAFLDVAPTAVTQFRLLGYSPVKDLENEPIPGILPAKTGTTLLIEVEARAGAKNLGAIHWKVDGKDAAPLPIQPPSDEAEPSNDARFAALLAAWSAWLIQEQPEIFDEDLVSGLARECAAGDLPKDRRDALVLIARSLELR